MIAVLLLSLSLSAQTAAPKKVAPKAAPKSKALIACEARADYSAIAPPAHKRHGRIPRDPPHRRHPV